MKSKDNNVAACEIFTPKISHITGPTLIKFSIHGSTQGQRFASLQGGEHGEQQFFPPPNFTITP